MNISNKIFFKLYQCANMLHKTGTRAVECEGLTTQQWAVLGALSRPDAKEGMRVGDLANYLMVSRQNLSGLIGRMQRDGHIEIKSSAQDKRSRLIVMTQQGKHVWEVEAQPKIHHYYQQALHDFSDDDLTHTLHYLLKLLNNMQQIDQQNLSDKEI